jgi:hypothetical protein
MISVIIPTLDRPQFLDVALELNARVSRRCPSRRRGAAVLRPLSVAVKARQEVTTQDDHP